MGVDNLREQDALYNDAAGSLPVLNFQCCDVGCQSDTEAKSEQRVKDNCAGRVGEGSGGQVELKAHMRKRTRSLLAGAHPVTCWLQSGSFFYARACAKGGPEGALRKEVPLAYVSAV